MTTTNSAKKGPKFASAPFEAFSFPTTSFEVPAAVRDFAEKSVSQVRDAYDKMKGAADEASALVGETFETAREGTFAMGVKAVDAAKTNSDASFALARELFGAKTMSEVIELQSAFARQLFESVTAQFKEFQALTEKVVTDTTKPVAEKVEKSFKAVAA